VRKILCALIALALLAPAAMAQRVPLRFMPPEVEGPITANPGSEVIVGTPSSVDNSVPRLDGVGSYKLKSSIIVINPDGTITVTAGNDLILVGSTNNETIIRQPSGPGLLTLEYANGDPCIRISGTATTGPYFYQGLRIASTKIMEWVATGIPTLKAGVDGTADLFILQDKNGNVRFKMGGNTGGNYNTYDHPTAPSDVWWSHEGNPLFLWDISHAALTRNPTYGTIGSTVRAWDVGFFDVLRADDIYNLTLGPPDFPAGLTASTTSTITDLENDAGTAFSGIITYSGPANHTVSGNKTVVFVNTTGGGTILTFPIRSGHTWFVKKITNDANVVTLQGEWGAQIDDAASYTSLAYNDGIFVACNGTNLRTFGAGSVGKFVTLATAQTVTGAKTFNKVQAEYITQPTEVTYSLTTNPISSVVDWVYCDISGGSITLTLPVIDGKVWHFKVIGWAGGARVTLQGATGNVDGAASNNSALNLLNAACRVRCDGTNFWIY